MLENILQNYFGCQTPFDEHGAFTTEGIDAYNKLCRLLTNVDTLCETNFSAEVIAILDEISDEN